MHARKISSKTNVARIIAITWSAFTAAVNALTPSLRPSLPENDTYTKLSNLISKFYSRNLICNISCNINEVVSILPTRLCRAFEAFLLFSLLLDLTLEYVPFVEHDKRITVKRVDLPKVLLSAKIFEKNCTSLAKSKITERTRTYSRIKRQTDRDEGFFSTFTCYIFFFFYFFLYKTYPLRFLMR